MIHKTIRVFQYILCFGSRFQENLLQKFVSCFNTSYVSVQDNWEDKINNSPEEIAGDEFIGELLTDPLLNFRVIKPDLLFYEKAFSGKNGFKNFMDVVKHFLSSSQKEGIEETKKFIYENNITMFKIEKIFKL